MTREEKKNALHCLKVMIDEEVCEECDLYGTTGTDHCEADCVRVAIEALEQKPSNDTVSCGVFDLDGAIWNAPTIIEADKPAIEDAIIEEAEEYESDFN